MSEEQESLTQASTARQRALEAHIARIEKGLEQQKAEAEQTRQAWVRTEMELRTRIAELEKQLLDR